MNSIDIKSLLIGALLTSTVIFGVAATSKSDAGAWDPGQKWEFKKLLSAAQYPGWEPVAVDPRDNDYVWSRRRIQ